MKRVFPVFLCALCYLFLVHGLALSESRPVKSFPRWVSYTNSNYAKHLILDQDVIWIASGGITRLDLRTGRRIKYLKEHGLSSNDTLKMTLFNGMLWIATANGITSHDIDKNEWKNFYVTDGLPDDAVTALKADAGRNSIWFGTWEGHLYRYDLSKNEWHFTTTAENNLNCPITALELDLSDHSLWIGTWGNGLYSFAPDSKKFEKQRSPSACSFEYISCLLKKDKLLFVGTPGKGLWLIDFNLKPPIQEKIGILPGHYITDIQKSLKTNELFLTTMDSGLVIYDEDIRSWKSITVEEGLPTDRLTSLAIGENHVFLGTEGEGLIQLDRRGRSIKQFKASNEIPHNRVSTLAFDPIRERIWLGTEGNGAASLEISKNQWEVLNVANKVLLSDVVNTIRMEKDAQAVWIGTDAGLVRYNPDKRSGRHYGFEQGLSNILVYAFEFDGQKRLWAGFYIGNPCLYIPERDKWKVVEQAPSVICYEISADRQENILWMATTEGLISYNIVTKKVDRHWTDIEFRSVYFDHENREVWGGSWGKSLYHLNLKNSAQTGIKGLGDISVLDIKKDLSTKIIWFATDRGVLYCKPGQNTFKHLDVKDGLGLRFVLSVGISSDSVWFGTWGGGLSRLLK